MKILHVMAGGPEGGAETAFVDIVTALADGGATVRAVTRAGTRRVDVLRGRGIPTDTARFGGLFDLATGLTLARIIRDFKPDIVQTWASRATQKTPRRVPGAPLYKTAARLGGYYKMKYYRRVDGFVANTPDIARYITAQGIAADRVRHINNFAEADPVQGIIRRATFDTPGDVKLALFLGRLHPVKAVDTLLQALTQLPDLWVWIAGEGPDEAMLKKMAISLGVADRVRFLGWQADRGDLFHAADLCIFPSRFEPFGNVLAQAWANRCPLVVSDAQGPRQYARNGEDALVFPVDDAGALAAAVRRLLGDPALRETLVANGDARFRAEFARDKVVQAYRGFYEDLLKTG